MDVTITRDEGHAHVGAIRVLMYRSGRPPTIEEIAELLGSQIEITNHRLRALEKLGIVKIVENPFEAHVSVADHRTLDDLPAEADEEAFSEAVEDFKKRQRAQADDMVRLFEEGDAEREKKDRQDEIESGLKGFKPKKPKKAPWEK
jgi:DNA-binding transcriptional regulator GbsR (MarR family)